MFGWLKSLFGSAPSPEPTLPVDELELKEVPKKIEKPVIKKTTSKPKVVKITNKKTEVELVTEDTALAPTTVDKVLPKKRGRRPKKSV